MKPLLVSPLFVIVAAALGLLVCKLAGVDPHVRAMSAASGICLGAAELAMAVVVVLYRPKTTLAATQASLIALVTHLLLCLLLGVVAVMLTHGNKWAVGWLLVMFWATLLGVSGGLLLVVRSTRPVKTATPVA